jgi:hypothetical protein
LLTSLYRYCIVIVLCIANIVIFVVVPTFQTLKCSKV